MKLVKGLFQKLFVNDLKCGSFFYLMW